MREKERLVLRYLIDNDTAMGCYALDIENALDMKTAASGVILFALIRSGLVEKRFQDEAPWPISGREAVIVPGEYPRRVYYRALPHARVTLAEQTQERTGQQPWGFLPSPATT